MWLFEKFKDFEDKNFSICKGNLYSYKWLVKEINSIEESLLKLKNKSVIAILGDYTLEAIALFLSLYKNKKIIVPISSNNEKEIKNKLETAKVEVVLKINSDETISFNQTTCSLSNPLIKKLVDVNRSGLVLFSSGSTGKPKAMIHDLDNLIEIYKNKKSKNLKILVFLMFDHIGGLNTLFTALSMGATIVIPEHRNPNYIANLIEKYKVNLLPTSPTFLNLLLISEGYKKYDLSSLRIITYGTEPMPESLLKRLRKIFPKVKFLQTFGTSETGIATTSSKSSESLYMKIEDPNVEWKVVDGELWLKGKTQILGYLNYNNPFTQDGWFPTGDLVKVTKDGYIKIIARKKEIINVGGQKVLPSEVEDVILGLEEVKDAIVYGEPNRITGQTVVAEVIVDKNIDKDTLKRKIKLRCKNKLERYKWPAKVKAVNKFDYGTRFKKKRKKQIEDSAYGREKD